MEQENNERILTIKKQLLISMILCTIAIVGTVIAFFLIMYPKINSNELLKDTFVQTGTNNTSEQLTEDVYVMKDYKGKIGIYKNDSLVYTLDKYIFTLPESDKKLLTEGIKSTNVEEFYRILEEYY